MQFRNLVRLGAATAAFALTVGFAPAATDALSDSSAAIRNSDNLELVANLPSTGGTDVEFFSRDLEAYKDADGEMVEGPTRRHFALVGNQSTGAQFVDITDPESPYEVARLVTCRLAQGDPQVNAEGTLATIGGQGGSCRMPNGANKSGGSAIVDLSDPYNPTPVGFAQVSGGSHNNTLAPGGRYLYISGSALAAVGFSVVPIFDLADPANPKFVRNLQVPANGPHDIRFNADGTRAYLAGISSFHIVNTENLENPSIITTILQPGGSIGHDTLITREGRFLFLGDEGGGGGTYYCPGGAVSVYDLLDERAPVFLGTAYAGGGPGGNRLITEPDAGTLGGCTSHVMELNPDGTSFTIGWYRLGTRVFDFSSFYEADGETPKTAAGVAAAWGEFGVGLVETAYMIPDNANTWSAKQYDEVPGYIFSDDLNLGFYVSKILD